MFLTAPGLRFKYYLQTDNSQISISSLELFLIPGDLHTQLLTQSLLRYYELNISLSSPNLLLPQSVPLCLMALPSLQLLRPKAPESHSTSILSGNHASSNFKIYSEPKNLFSTLLLLHRYSHQPLPVFPQSLLTGLPVPALALLYLSTEMPE